MRYESRQAPRACKYHKEKTQEYSGEILNSTEFCTCGHLGGKGVKAGEGITLLS